MHHTLEEEQVLRIIHQKNYVLCITHWKNNVLCIIHQKKNKFYASYIRKTMFYASYKQKNNVLYIIHQKNNVLCIKHQKKNKFYASYNQKKKQEEESKSQKLEMGIVAAAAGGTLKFFNSVNFILFIFFNQKSKKLLKNCQPFNCCGVPAAAVLSTRKFLIQFSFEFNS